MFTKTLTIIIAALGAASSAPAAAQITLDAGTLDAIERADPARFRKLAKIIRIATETDCGSAATILKTRFEVKDARCETMLLMTSDPPKRRLSFRLDETAYVANITVRNAGGKLVPIPSP